MIEKIQCRSNLCRYKWIPRVENPLKCPACGFPYRAPKKRRKALETQDSGLLATVAEHNALLNVEVSKQLP